MQHTCFCCGSQESSTSSVCSLETQNGNANGREQLIPGWGGTQVRDRHASKWPFMNEMEILLTCLTVLLTASLCSLVARLRQLYGNHSWAPRRKTQSVP